MNLSLVDILNHVSEQHIIEQLCFKLDKNSSKFLKFLRCTRDKDMHKRYMFTVVIGTIKNMFIII